MKPVYLAGTKIAKSVCCPGRLRIGDQHRADGHCFDLSEIKILGKLLTNIARHEMPKWRKK